VVVEAPVAASRGSVEAGAVQAEVLFRQRPEARPGSILVLQEADAAGELQAFLFSVELVLQVGQQTARLHAVESQSEDSIM